MENDAGQTERNEAGQNVQWLMKMFKTEERTIEVLMAELRTGYGLLTGLMTQVEDESNRMDEMVCKCARRRLLGR